MKENTFFGTLQTIHERIETLTKINNTRERRIANAFLEGNKDAISDLRYRYFKTERELKELEKEKEELFTILENGEIIC